MRADRPEDTGSVPPEIVEQEDALVGEADLPAPSGGPEEAPRGGCLGRGGGRGGAPSSEAGARDSRGVHGQ